MRLKNAPRKAIGTKPQLAIREGLTRPKAIDAVRQHDTEDEWNARHGDDSARH